MTYAEIIKACHDLERDAVNIYRELSVGEYIHRVEQIRKMVESKQDALIFPDGHSDTQNPSG